MWESLSENHPFLDGNKRVAVTVIAAFLKVNDYTLVFDDRDAYGFLMGLYGAGRMRSAELDTWIRKHVVPER